MNTGKGEREMEQQLPGPRLVRGKEKKERADEEQ